MTTLQQQDFEQLTALSDYLATQFILHRCGEGDSSQNTNYNNCFNEPMNDQLEASELNRELSAKLPQAALKRFIDGLQLSDAIKNIFYQNNAEHQISWYRLVRFMVAYRKEVAVTETPKTKVFSFTSKKAPKKEVINSVAVQAFVTDAIAADEQAKKPAYTAPQADPVDTQATIAAVKAQDAQTVENQASASAVSPTQPARLETTAERQLDFLIAFHNTYVDLGNPDFRRLEAGQLKKDIFYFVGKRNCVAPKDYLQVLNFYERMTALATPNSNTLKAFDAAKSAYEDVLDTFDRDIESLRNRKAFLACFVKTYEASFVSYTAPTADLDIFYQIRSLLRQPDSVTMADFEQKMLRLFSRLQTSADTKEQKKGWLRNYEVGSSLATAFATARAQCPEGFQEFSLPRPPVTAGLGAHTLGAPMERPASLDNVPRVDSTSSDEHKA